MRLHLVAAALLLQAQGSAILRGGNQGPETRVDFAIDDTKLEKVDHTHSPTEGLAPGPTPAPSDPLTPAPMEAPTTESTPLPMNPRILATVCNISSLFSDDFANDSGLGFPHGWYANYDSAGERIADVKLTNEEAIFPGNQYALFQNRKSKNHGPRHAVDITCINPNKIYAIEAMIRLTKPLFSGESDCATTGSNCLFVRLVRQDAGGVKKAQRVGHKQAAQHSHPDGIWFRISFPVKFDSEYLDATNMVKRDIYFKGPEPGVEIAIDDVKLVVVGDVSTTTTSPLTTTTTITTTTTVTTTTTATTTTTTSSEAQTVVPAGFSEQIIIPHPPEPAILGGPRTGCPHMETNLLDWHHQSTWDNELVPPTDGSDVMLPEHSRIIIRQSIAGMMGIITVPSTSELIFGEDMSFPGAGIEVSARGFNVFGNLTAGSETCRLEQPLTITLHGDRPEDLDDHGKSHIATPTYKGIALSGGRLELHGKRYYRTWTRLAATAKPGDTNLRLQHAVNWEPGQEIVLVTSALKDSRDWHRNEVLTVGFGGIDPPDEVTVPLTSPVVHEHVATLAYQAEVGLLTRIIKIQGAEEDSEPTSLDDGTYTDRSVYGHSGAPDPTKNLDGFGGHIVVKDGGLGFVEGVELYRMGQTNVLGRYPMHFHILGNDCLDCYFKDSSIHHSYYRCVSVHGTHGIIVSENVAYDVTGHCYYLEDGIEEDNTMSFNLAAFVHFLGTAPTAAGHTTSLNYQSKDLILPADVTASGFYITNIHNNIIGNAVSGGWAGFSFPVLHSPIGPHRTVNFRPSSRTSLTIDGNTAHSSGWWWSHSGGFYFGGSIFYDSNDMLVYNAGSDGERRRSPCNKDHCASGNCGMYCKPVDQAWVRITNSKAFLIPGVGLNSWSGRLEIVGIEAHDVGLSIQAFEFGIWIDSMLAVCRTGEAIVMPPGGDPTRFPGNGFKWYDTNQKHIITESTFRNCGYRQSDSNAYDQYDTSPTRGCYDSPSNGCHAKSSVFGFLTHSDKNTPELMQATSRLNFENCGRRFKMIDFCENRNPPPPSSVSGRTQNWVDVDGTASDLNESTLIGSGLPDAGMWWNVEEDVAHDTQAPLIFIKTNNGPSRGLGHMKILWDPLVQAEVGKSTCGNGQDWPCETLGYIKHFGPMFATDDGLPVTANANIVGPTGGYGWLLRLTKGAPLNLKVQYIEVDPTTPLILGVQYPQGTTLTITAQAGYCSINTNKVRCTEVFHSVTSHAAVRASLGNTYHMDSNGFLTVRIIELAKNFLGTPDWIFPTYDTPGKKNIGYALERFSRGEVTLPQFTRGSYVMIKADCATADDVYCFDQPAEVDIEVCSLGYKQVSYDKCCLELSHCEDARTAQIQTTITNTTNAY